MRVHCKPGASGQGDIFTATCNSLGSAGGAWAVRWPGGVGGGDAPPL